MKDWLRIISMAIGAFFVGMLLITAVLAFTGFFVTVGLGAVGILAVAWVLGLPIKVTSNGKTIGHYRRTTFYPVRRPLDIVCK